MLHRSSRSALEWLFSISYLWYRTIGVSIFIIIGSIVSLITGKLSHFWLASLESALYDRVTSVLCMWCPCSARDAGSPREAAVVLCVARSATRGRHRASLPLLLLQSLRRRRRGRRNGPADDDAQTTRQLDTGAVNACGTVRWHWQWLTCQCPVAACV